VEKINQVKKAAEHAAALTRQLLTFGRQQVVQSRVLDINAIVGASSEILRQIGGEGVECVTILDPALGLIKADAGQIEQILMNLIVNAKGAMPEGGRITIKTQNVTVNGTHVAQPLNGNPGPYVMLSVSDSGCGMDAATIGRIFEPFYTTKEEGKGTGLGLAIVYGIVKQNAGEIRVVSRPGHGTKFEILLPQTEAQEERLEPLAVLAEALVRSKTILVLADEPAVRELISVTLKDKGYDVRVARDGNEALQISEREGGIGLILTDVIMPGMNGPTLVESLTRLNPAMRVLYMSGYADDAIAGGSEFVAVTPLIQKPFTAKDLIGKVGEILNDSNAVRLGAASAT
jgi:CheY-like chemotaxis protein